MFLPIFQEDEQRDEMNVTPFMREDHERAKPLYAKLFRVKPEDIITGGFREQGAVCGIPLEIFKNGKSYNKLVIESWENESCYRYNNIPVTISQKGRKTEFEDLRCDFYVHGIVDRKTGNLLRFSIIDGKSFQNYIKRVGWLNVWESEKNSSLFARYYLTPSLLREINFIARSWKLKGETSLG